MASTSDSNASGEHNSLLIDQFCSVTGSSKEKAVKMLEVCNWNLEMAVNMHVDSDFPENDCSAGDHINNANASTVDSESVRPPIPPSRGVLVEEDPGYHYGLRGRKRRPHSIFDGFRDFQAEARWQEFSAGARPENSETLKKRRTFEDLFRPPLDIMHRGSFESARDLGQNSNRWLMVNVQDSQEFSCQVLNRDIWSNAAIKNLITQNFVFWQVYSDSLDGQRYMQFYKPVEFPYIAVIDPRTGENLIVWHKVDATDFSDLVTNFLNEHLSPNGPLKSDTSAATKYSVLDQSEEYQIKAALEASLKEAALVTVDDTDSDFETFDSDSESPNNKASKVNSVHFSSDHSNDPIDVVSLNESNDHDHDDITDKQWKDYIGSEDDPKSELVIRLPSGKREQITWPCSTKIKALLLYIGELGFNEKEYELVTNFPRRNLCQVDLTKTLKEIGLYPREMVFVQLKS